MGIGMKDIILGAMIYKGSWCNKKSTSTYTNSLKKFASTLLQEEYNLLIMDKKVHK
jgi:hypothetical protein